MPDWLGASFSSSSWEVWRGVAVQIGFAWVYGIAVAGIYRWARRGETIQTTFLTTLVLLATLIAMATQVIGGNLARAFGLVGALSVVRFRTVVKDTQDTAFVIFAVVVGMSAGANNSEVGLIGLVILALAALVLWPPGRSNVWQTSNAMLKLRVGQTDGTQTAVEEFLTRSTTRYELVEAETAKKGASLDLIYLVRLRPAETPTNLVSGLTLLKGVENVGLSRRE